MRKLLPLVLVLGAALPVLAQESVPTIIVQNGGKPEHLGLIELSYEVRIFGYFAETSATMTFANSQARLAEGDLYFPLPQGATVSGYALDIQGKMVDGVSVDKQRATTIFETEKARRIDPGLVEWTRRDHFRTRVFPIPARGQRVVRVQYVSELEDGVNGVSYRLPLGFTQSIPQFALRVEVVNPAAEPKVRQSAVANFHFARWHDSFVAETKLENARLGKELIVALPDVQRQNVQVEKADDGQVYFAIHDLPPTAAAAQPPFRPKHVVIYWDASGSRASIDHEREIAAVKALLDRWTAASPRSLQVDLVLLRNVLSPPCRFELGGKNVECLTEELKKVDYDGGTQLGALAPIGDETPDYALLFSDGVSTFGRSEPAPLAAPLYVFSSQGNSDWAVLEHLAHSNGGQCFDLAQVSDAEVATAIAQSGYRPLAARVVAGQISQVLPSEAGAVGRFSVIGRLESPQAAVMLRYGAAGLDAVQRTFTIDGTEATSGSLLRRLWAQRKLDELLVHEQRNQQQIAALGREYGLVTPFTSLMVLETLQQYLAYGIEPPESLPGIRKKYLRQLQPAAKVPRAHQDARQRSERSAKIAEVVRLWEERVKWWSTDVRRSNDLANRDRSRSTVRPIVPSGLGGNFGFGMPLAIRPFPATAQPQSGSMGASFSGGMGGMGMGGISGFGGIGGAMNGLGGIGAPAAALTSVRTPAADNPELPADNDGQFSAKVFRHYQSPQITLQPYDPNATYVKELKAAANRQAFTAYLRNRSRYARSPDFFLDCADFFFGRQENDRAMQVLSNLAELQSDDPSLRRRLAVRLARAGEYDLAIVTLEDAIKVWPNGPQAYRDLALVLVQRADAARAAITGRKTSQLPPKGRAEAPAEGRSKADIAGDYARAVDLFTEIVVRRWDNRFAEVELPALMELNRLLARTKAYGIRFKGPDPRLCRLLDLDLRIVVTWDTGDAGLKLVVSEPSGEKAGMDHSPTKIGGQVSRKSAVYGPVEYLVRRAMNGEYVVQAAFDGLAGQPQPVTVHVDIFTNFGRDKEQCRSITLRLYERAHTVTLGQVKF